MNLKPSSLVLIAANLLPIGGVLWFDWSVFEILLLYWTESVIIGVINVLRMLASQSTNMLAGFTRMHGRAPEAATAALNSAGSQLPRRGIKTFLIPFFAIHYGVFCYGHLSAVVGIFSDKSLHGGLLGAVPPLSDFAFWALVASIFASHLFSFFANFIGKGEYKRTGAATLMQRPYGRIVVMHITVIVGAGLVMWLNNPLPMLVVLVAAKTILDLNLHNRERQRFAIET
jgi:hypothetical protein